MCAIWVMCIYHLKCRSCLFVGFCVAGIILTEVLKRHTGKYLEHWSALCCICHHIASAKADLVLVELSHAQVPLLLSQLSTAVRCLVRLLCFVCKGHKKTQRHSWRSGARYFPRLRARLSFSQRLWPTSAGHGGAHPVAACAHAAVALHLGLGSVFVGLVLKGAFCREEAIA